MRAPSLRHAALVLPFLALASCSGPVLFAELEMPSVEVTLPQHEFQGFVSGTLTETVSFDLGANVPVVNEPNVEFELKLTRMTLVLQTGDPANFDGFFSVRITAIDPGGDPSRDLDLLYWERGGATGVTRIEATSETDADLKPYLAAGVLTVRAEYVRDGGLPVQLTPWTADLTAEFWMKVKLDYGAYL